MGEAMIRYHYSSLMTTSGSFWSWNPRPNKKVMVLAVDTRATIETQTTEDLGKIDSLLWFGSINFYYCKSNK